MAFLWSLFQWAAVAYTGYRIALGIFIVVMSGIEWSRYDAGIIRDVEKSIQGMTRTMMVSDPNPPEKDEK